VTINQARAILNFIIKHKIKGTPNEELTWLLANEFNVEDKDHEKES